MLNVKLKLIILSFFIELSSIKIFLYHTIEKLGKNRRRISRGNLLRGYLPRGIHDEFVSQSTSPIPGGFHVFSVNPG
jgi:hypothetical protein